MSFITDWQKFAENFLRSRNKKAFLVNDHSLMVIAGTGTIAANGTLTLNVAAPIIMDGGAWLHFPAGAVVGGQAGFYWTVMSSTTVGQVYTNFINIATSTSLPQKPTGSLTLATGSNSSYSNSAGSFNFINLTIPANTIQQGSAMKIGLKWGGSGSGNKIGTLFIDSIALTASNPTSNNATGFLEITLSSLKDQINRQIAATNQLFATAGTFHTFDFTQNRLLQINFRNSTATDTAILYGVSIEIIKNFKI